MEKAILEILVCPACKGSLHYNKKNSELMCFFDHYAYPIQDGIPVMLVSAARELTETEIAEHKNKRKTTGS